MSDVTTTALIVPNGIDFCASDKSPDLFEPDMKPATVNKEIQFNKGLFSFQQQPPQTVWLGETQRARKANAADLIVGGIQQRNMYFSITTLR